MRSTGRRRWLWCGVVAMVSWLGWKGAAQTAEPGVTHEELAIEVDGRKTRLHRFRIDVAKMRADVFDLGFKIPVVEALANTAFVMNGGYWEYHLGKQRMIGWVVSGGKQLSPLRRKLDGGVLLIREARARVVRSDQLDPKPAGVELAVQCKPRLVESGKIIAQLDAKHRAARTAVCTRDDGKTLDAYLSDPRDRGPTLDALARRLAADGCVDALNLDGGPSTAAAFSRQNAVLRVGVGVNYPYAIRFTPR